MSMTGDSKTEMADWSNLPKDIYVIGAQSHSGIAFDVQCCSVPMVTAPEVRYTRADLCVADTEMLAALESIRDMPVMNAVEIYELPAPQSPRRPHNPITPRIAPGPMVSKESRMNKLRNDWFCAGCRKLHHRHQRDIEGSNHAGYWCAASIVRGIAAKRNDLPNYDLALASRGHSLARRAIIAA